MIVLPDQPLKLRWDAGISMICVLVAVLTPYRIAFARNDDSGWLIFDATVDFLFVIGEGFLNEMACPGILLFFRLLLFFLTQKNRYIFCCCLRYSVTRVTVSLDS